VAYPRKPKNTDPNAESPVTPIRQPPDIGGQTFTPPPLQTPKPRGGAPTRREPTTVVAPTTNEYAQFRAPAWQRASYIPPAPENLVNVPKPPWSLEQVRDNQPQATKFLQDKLWQQFQKLPEDQKTETFWQGVGQNPEMAAAAVVRRILHNATWHDEVMMGRQVPTLDQAMSAAVQNRDDWRWLHWLGG
jgi:hypothetical protein